MRMMDGREDRTRCRMPSDKALAVPTAPALLWFAKTEIG
jgi:hypothetical protein